MNIKNYTQSKFTSQIDKKVSFSGGKTDDLLKVMPETKVSKNLTQLDINCFRTYVLARPFRMKISSEDINTLKNLDGNEFLLKAHELISKEFGIPDEIAPGLFPAKLNPEIIMAYIPHQNVICLNIDASNISKGECFGFMRHEFQHYLQNISILRHETIGKKALDEYTKSFIDVQKVIIKPFLEMSDEEIMNNQNLNHEIILKLKDCTLKNDRDAVDKIYDAMAEEYRALIESLRNKSIEKMGLIKADSAETPKIEKMYNEFLNIGYYKQGQQIDYQKYIDSAIEKDAIRSQLMAQSAFEGECPIATNKAAFFNILKTDPKFFDNIN